MGHGERNGRDCEDYSMEFHVYWNCTAVSGYVDLHPPTRRAVLRHIVELTRGQLDTWSCYFFVMADTTYGGGAAAAPLTEASTSAKDSRDTLYSFDESKLELIRKTKPWMQE